MNKTSLKKLYDSGLSLRDIGKLYNVDGTTILYYMKKFNIKRRTRTEIQKGKFGKLSRGWKGGRRKNSNGYILLYNPNYYSADVNGYIREHIYKIEQFLKTKLNKGEEVHHIDGNRSNNELSNLFIFKNKQEHKHFELLLQIGKVERFSLNSNLNNYRKET